MIRIGRRVGSKEPSIKGWYKVRPLTKSSKHFSLSPYSLRQILDDGSRGPILENLWQFSKIYSTTPSVRRPYSRWDKRIIWERGSETHIVDSKITQEYMDWRRDGFNCGDAIRYPVGYNHRHLCRGLIKDPAVGMNVDENGLGYIDSRVEVYIPEYIKSVKMEDDFVSLKKRYEGGENILIIDVDGPHQESLDYYVSKYGVVETFIENGCVNATPESLAILMGDEKHPFGHGYCLAMALMDLDVQSIRS